MQKNIQIDGKEYKFKASAATLVFYKNKFGADLLVDMNSIIKNFDPKGESMPADIAEKFGRIAYIMNKQADPEQPDSWEEWLDQFEMFSIIEIFPQILELWNLNTAQSSKPKKDSAR